ncbi:tail tape measure protein [Listeria monocytogenes]|nr:tail tape measure protein [Listeria monocytogenes]EAG8714017.1 tail tape measure protein [Listeria monocytogenes]EAG8732388.1 tail tape measure protein [Listeria monocytogenes]
MANEASNVVLNFKMDGQVQYAQTIKEINQVMNIAAKEYKAHIAAMGDDATATDKLRATQKKLEIQLEGAQKRTAMLRAEYEKMTQDTNTSTDALNKQYGKLMDAERAESSLSNQLKATNAALVEQNSETVKNHQALQRLKQEVSELDAESQKLTSEFKLQQSELGENATEAEKLAVAQDHLGKQMNLTEKQIQNMEQQLELVKKEYGENSVEANKMESELNDAKTSFNNLGKEMNQLADDSKRSQNEMTQLTNVVKADAFMAASEKVGELGQKVKELGQYALESFREVDEGLDTVLTKTGATGKAGAELTTVFNNIAGNSKFEFQKVGDAVGEVNTQFGLTDKKLEETSLELLKFADINNSDVTTSTMNAKMAMEAYGLENKDLGMILDSVTHVSQGTGQSIDDIFDKAVKGAPQIEALGLSFADGAQLMANMDKAGVDSSATLSSLTKASVVYAKENKTLAQGLSELQGKILGAKTETEKINIAAEVFGSKGGPRMVKAIEDGRLSLDGLAGTAETSAGTVSKTFDETLDPIDKQDEAINNLKLTFAEFGNTISEVLTPVLKILNGIMKGLSALPEPVKMVLVVLGILVVVLGAILPLVAAFAVTAAAAGLSMGALAAVMLPIIGIVAGIVAGITLLVTGIVWLWNNVEGFRNFWTGVWEWIKNAFKAAWDVIQPGLQAIGDSLKKFWEEYSPLLISAVQWISDKINEFITFIQPIWTFFWENVGSTLKFVWDAIVATVTFALDYIGGLIDIFVGLFTGDWDRMAKGVNKIWDALWKLVTSIIDSAKEAVMDKVDSLVKLVNSAVEWLRDTIKDKFEDIQAFMEDPIGSAKDFIKDILDDITGFFDDLDLKFPKIEMPELPHFSMEGEFSLKNMTVPSISVDWRAQGGIFTQPTIFGASGGRLQGAGEAGDEAVLPLNAETLGKIGQGIASTMGGGGAEIHLHIDTLVADNMASIDRLNKNLQLGAMKAKNMLGER